MRGDVGKSVNARPLPRRPYRANTPLRVPKAPTAKSTTGARWWQGEHSDARGETGPTALPIAMRCRERTQQPEALLASLRSARVLTGPYSAFSNRALERLVNGMANMRLISRGAGPDRGQLFRCGL
jgi:hypothetical protein